MQPLLWFTKERPNVLLRSLLYVAKGPWDHESRSGQLLWRIAAQGWHVDYLYETNEHEVKKAAQNLYINSRRSLLQRTKYGVVWTEKEYPLPRRTRSILIQEYQAADEPINPNAQLLFCGSAQLFASLNGKHPNVHLILDGCVGDLFKEPTQVPDEFLYVRRPIIGYVGSLDDEAAVELIRQAAAYYRYCSFVLIGECMGVGPSNLSPNVYILGPRSIEDMPPYLHHLDMIILKPPEESVLPKVYEFLALGKPLIVFTQQDLGGLAPLVFGSRTPDQLQTHIHEFLAELGLPLDETGLGLKWGSRSLSLSDLEQEPHDSRPHPPTLGHPPKKLFQQRKQLALANSWQARAEQVLTAIQKTFAQQDQVRGWFL